MSRHLAFRRQPVDQQVAQHLRTITLPAPTRGLVKNENEAYEKPGGALVHDNWAPTMRGVKLRGGYIRWCDTGVRESIISAFEYVTSGQELMFAANATTLFNVTSSTPAIVKSGQHSGNYVASQFANDGGNWMIAANDAADYLLRFDGTSWVTLNAASVGTSVPWQNGTSYAVDALVTDPDKGSRWRCLVAHTSATTGFFVDDRAQNPSYWKAEVASDGVSWITGPPDSNVPNGNGLSYVWKYRNRLFFIESGSMNVWYLGTNSVGGELTKIPMAGSATKGGYLLFGAVWSSADAGDGTDDRCVFVTNLGEILIFSGSDPADIDNWRQEGRYDISPPLGMNAHIVIGGDLIILTVDGAVPLSQAITKTAGQLELAMLSRTIKPIWRQEALTKRGQPWTAKKWDEYGAVFVSTPGGLTGSRYCFVVNNATGAWGRYGPNYDATCFIRLRGDMFFGTQDGFIMQMERTGYDDGNGAKLPYVATLVGGWEMFGAPSAHFVWHQTRVAYKADRQYRLQLAAMVNYVMKIPQPPPPSPDVPDVGAAGDDTWDSPTSPWGPLGSSGRAPTPEEITLYGQWDNGPANLGDEGTGRNTLWVSIGKTGFAHAPIVQITIGQQARPILELVALSVTYEPAGVNVD
jgi:hypothetical protein